MIQKFWNSYWPGLLWTIASFILLILPGSSFPQNNWFGEIYLDKWIHLFLFSVFIITWSLAWQKLPMPQQRKIALKLFLSGILFGVIMEVVQHYWVPGRSFEIKDILSDAFGCFIGWLVVTNHLKRSKKERPL
ncbi:MAG: VanZ family protein [Sphingobacteriales bacterium]|nr:VanZ family protein [Sphingobacteriales bacterium]